MNGVEQKSRPTFMPVVDVQSICKSDEGVGEEAYLRVGKKIVEAFQECGYVYLENSGIRKETIKSVREDMESFFKLDPETKEKYHRSLITFNGYSTDKTEVISSEETPMSERETFDFGTYPSFPDEVPSLRDSVPNLNKQVFPLIIKTLKALELALDIPDNLLQKQHDLSSSDSLTELRVLKYLPINDTTQIRIKEHIDSVTFTFQIYESEKGLQVQDKNGIWQDVHISPKTILLFPGQILQMLTADKILATNHRVVVPETKEGRQRDRYSFIYFIAPNRNAMIKPFDGSDKYTPSPYKTILYKAFKELSKDWEKYEECTQLD